MNRRSWLAPALGCAVFFAPVSRAAAAQAAPGFPKKVASQVTSPTASARQADGMVRLYFAIADELHCVQGNGRDCEGFPVALGQKVALLGAPASADLDADGAEEVVAALSDGRVVVVREDGSAFGSFSWQAQAGLQTSASLIDVDGDGKPEIVIGDKVGRLHALRADGSEAAGFPLGKGGAITSPASWGLFGEPGRRTLVWGNEDGRVYAAGQDGKQLPGFPVATGYLVSGQPAIADLDGDGGVDVAFASQDFKIYAVRQDGSLFPGFPVATGARLLSGPALGDVDGDGRLELAVAATDGKLHLVNARGEQLKGYPVKLGERIAGAALIADLDRDGAQEVLAATADGKLHALKSGGKPFPGFPAKLEGLPDDGPVVFELDGAVIVAQAAGEKISAFKVRRAGKSNEPLAWPEAGHDSSRGGRRFPNPPTYAALRVSPESPATDDEPGVDYRFFDLDGDPEPATQIRWFRDGKEMPELAGKRSVPKELTAKKQRWKFELSAPGAVTRMSPEAVVVNSRPGAPRLAFDPDPPRRVAGVKVRIAEPAPDADGDSIRYSYAWLKDGRPQKGLDAPELAPLSINKGERWTVVVTGSDGEAEGPAVSLEAVVADSAPTAPAVALVPAAPKRGEPIKIVVKREASDVDSDALRYRYRFSIDGVAQPFASEVDTLPALTARERQVVSAEVWADDGELLGPVATAQATLLNTPPAAPTPAIFPAGPRHGDTLSAGLAAPSLDSDGDPLIYRFAFSKGGKRLSPPESVPSVRKGESYELEAIANDGEADSAPARVSVKVLNTPPTTPMIAFERLPLRRVDSFKVKIVEPSTDVDGDKIAYSYAWSRNGEQQPSLTGPELPAGTARKGERWIVSVTASDGEEQGRPARLEAQAVDSAPTAPEIALNPDSPKTGDEIRAVVRRDASDVDADKLRYRYRFFVDGTPLALEDSANALPKFTVAKHREVEVRVQADDGEQLGPVATARVKVGNTAPEAPKALLLPARPMRNDTLEAALSSLASDADGDRLAYRFSFSKDGKRIEASADGREVGGLRKGERYEVAIIANDGEADSPAATASVMVENGLPTAPVIAFAQLPLRRVDPVEVKIVAPSIDADGDPISYAYSWTRNGQLQQGLTGPTLPAGTVRKGERWEITVLPSDGSGQGAAAKLEAQVVDSPPTAPEIALTPESPKTGDEIRAVVRREASDVDGDKLRYRYRFLVDGTPLNFADTVSALPVLTVGKKHVVSVEVRADDGEALGPVALAKATVVNTPPEPPEVLLLPREPQRGDSLQAAIGKNATDIDGDPLTYRFAFTKNGKRIDASALGRVAGELRKGERYEVTVVAHDGEADSAPAGASALVKNTLPTAPAVSFSDVTPKSGTAIEVRTDRPSLDADGDGLTFEYLFSVNGKLALPKDTRSIPSGRIKKHETWTVEVIPYDGDQKGPSGKAHLVAANSAPTAPKIAIEPAEPTADSGARVTMLAQSSDHDADPVSYRHAWYLDGVKLDLPSTATEIKPGTIKRGEQLMVVVTPWDGEVEGESSSASARVKNSPPAPPQISIEPARPTVKDALVCAIKKAAKDPDREAPQLRYVWKRDGTVVPLGMDQPKVPAGVARHGETWSCEVVATDGELSSEPVKVDAKVLNSAPSASTAVVEPSKPRAGDDLLCRLSAAAEDSDADTLAYQFRWTSGGKPVQADDKAPWRLPASSLRKGRNYRCEVIASDDEAAGKPATAEGAYVNSPPDSPKVRLEPGEPAPDTTLTCKIERAATDPDGDTVRNRFAWWKNGVQQSFAQSSAQVPARLVKPGDIWRCGVVATDGEAEGAMAFSQEAIVANRPASAER